jgi:glycosyltransferase involved in cell wall biosynthesis
VKNLYSIAMVAACPFPANHGTPAAIREMSQELARRGHSVRVVTYPLHDDIAIAGVAIDRVRQIGRSRKVRVGPGYQRLVFDLLLVFKLLQVVRAHRIDRIHAHNYEAALVAALVGRLTGVPVIYNAINTMIGELPSYDFIRPRFLAKAFARFLDRITPRLADLIVADTDELRFFLLEKGLPSDRVITIHSGVSPEMFARGEAGKIRTQFSLQNARLILYAGTFDTFQGLDYLLAAFPAVLAKFPDAHLLLAGGTINPAHQRRIASAAEKLGIASHITITSATLDQLPDFLAAAEVAVVPRPESAGIPTKLLNYMAAAKPIVSFAKSATILEHNKNAHLVFKVSADELAKGIVELLAHPERARDLGRNARALIPGRFDWSTIAEQIEIVYARAPGKKNRANEPCRRRSLFAPPL